MPVFLLNLQKHFNSILKIKIIGKKGKKWIIIVDHFWSKIKDVRVYPGNNHYLLRASLILEKSLVHKEMKRNKNEKIRS